MGKKAIANDCIMALAKQTDSFHVEEGTLFCGLGSPHQTKSVPAAPSDDDDDDDEEEEEESFFCESS
jgi:hypothetical protein